MTHPNEDLARRAYDAFATGDMATLDSLIADDSTWYIAGTSAISGQYDGKQATFEFFRQLAELSGGTFSIDIHDIVANDDHTVALVQVHAERNGKRIDDKNVHAMHIEDGKIASFWSFAWDQDALNAFWGSTAGLAVDAPD